MELTVTSKGRQFDRLGLMYLGDIEVFRTSTAEPTENGIVWTYVKEMDQYNVLWKTEQKIIFDLGNLISDVYTGTFNTTLTATFFTTPFVRETADEILPISAKQSFKNQGSAFTIPSQTAAVTYRFPQNVKKAVVSLSACGQGEEEFWYSNALSSETDTFRSTTGPLSGGSPFREVQILIDGKLAGVSWPFPVIFTGGIAPGFWRPIVGIDAFDLREHEIDITPWIGLLGDGNSHTFEIKVVGLDDDGAGHASLSKSVGSSWIVSGKIFLFIGKAEPIRIRLSASVELPLPHIEAHSTISKNSAGENETLTYGVTVTRQLRIASSFASINDPASFYWTQNLSYSSYNKLSDQGAAQFTSQTTSGQDESSSGYKNTYRYPLTIKTSFFTDQANHFGINATISRGLDFNINSPSIFPSGIQNLPTNPPPNAPPPPKTLTLLSTTQAASAQFFSAGPASYSFGTTSQDFSFNASTQTTTDVLRETYYRHVLAVNATVVEDSDATHELSRISVSEAGVLAFGRGSVRKMLGRGPEG